MGKRASMVMKAGLAVAAVGGIMGFTLVASHQSGVDCRMSGYVLSCGSFLGRLAYPLQNFLRVLGAAAGALPGIVVALWAWARTDPSPTGRTRQGTEEGGGATIPPCP